MREYFDGNREYTQYSQALVSDPDLSFYYQDSVRYCGTTQLLKLGRLRVDSGYDAVVAAYQQKSTVAQEQHL